MTIETRNFDVYAEPEALEIRADDGGDPWIGGYAARFSSPSKDLGGFTEIIAPGAFKNSLAGPRDVRALVSHDPDRLLARQSNKTLRVWEDDKGLRFEAQLPRGVSYANDLIELMKRGTIGQMSFGFTVPKGGDLFESTSGKTTRTVRAAELHEISVVATPAYDATNVSLRIDPAVLAAATAIQKQSNPEMLKRKRLLRITALKG
jgi:uncharacterized protein